jgi:hypothetical protein
LCIFLFSLFIPFFFCLPFGLILFFLTFFISVYFSSLPSYVCFFLFRFSFSIIICYYLCVRKVTVQIKGATL